MAPVVGFALLVLLWYGFAFGATRLLLRRTPWHQYSLEAPWLTGPALLVLVVSALGYREPWVLPAWQAWACLVGGWVLSLVVLWWDREELTELIRSRGRQACLIVGPALVAAAVMIAFFPGNIWDTLAIPEIGELTNYAEMAAVLTGHHQGEVG